MKGHGPRSSGESEERNCLRQERECDGDGGINELPFYLPSLCDRVRRHDNFKL